MAYDSTVNSNSVNSSSMTIDQNAKLAGMITEEINPNPYYGDSASSVKISGQEYAQLAYGQIMNTVDDSRNTMMYGVESQLLRGTMSFSPERLKELDPSYQGFTHVFVLREPPVMTQVARGHVIAGYAGTDKISAQRRAQIHCQNLKALFEMGCTAYSGTPDLTLNSTQVQVGWNDRSYAAPTFSEWSSTNFSLTVLETRGDPLRHGVEYYITAVGDPNLKATTMNGALDDEGNLLQPTLSNITWTFMIVQTDQTNINIQDITIWTNVTVGSIDRSTLDWNNGTVDIVGPRDVPCNGVMLPMTDNVTCQGFARALLYQRLKFYRRYSDMDDRWLGAGTWHTPNVDWSAQ